MWSTPWMSPLATDGAAPRITTNMIACSLSLNSRIASGNHAIDGMVCRPVMSDPMAARRMANRATSAPTTTPITIASAKPTTPRRSVIAIAFQSATVRTSSHSRASTSTGLGRTKTDFQPVQTTSCQKARTMTTASTFGQVALHPRRTADSRRAVGASSASSPATSAERGVSCVTLPAMTRALPPEPRGHRAGQRRHVGILDPARARDVDAELLGHAAGSRGEQHDPVAEARRLAHVVGDEQDGLAGGLPDPLQLVVEHVARHRVERTERLVHQQDLGVAGERPGEGRPLAHPARELVRLAPREGRQLDHVEELGHMRAAVRLRDLLELQRQLDVLLDGQPREQRRLLEHERRLAGPMDGATRRGLEAGDEVEQG